jgi:hypothetical protein
MSWLPVRTRKITEQKEHPVKIVDELERLWREAVSDSGPELEKVREAAAAEVTTLKEDVKTDLANAKAEVLAYAEQHLPEIKDWAEKILVKVEQAVHSALAKH